MRTSRKSRYKYDDEFISLPILFVEYHLAVCVTRFLRLCAWISTAIAHTIHDLYYTAFDEYIDPYIQLQRLPRATGHVSECDN